MKSVVLLVVLFGAIIVACSHDAPGAGSFAAVGANQAVLSASDQIGDATIAIKGITCSPVNPSAYNVTVEWLSSVDEGQRGILEYNVISEKQDADKANINKTAMTFDVSEGSGQKNFEISHSEVEDVGESVVVKLKVQREGGDVVASLPDELPISELCGD